MEYPFEWTPLEGSPMMTSPGAMVLPLMIFHQIQLMVCAVLARRYKRQTEKLAQKETRAAKA